MREDSETLRTAEQGLGDLVPIQLLSYSSGFWSPPGETGVTNSTPHPCISVTLLSPSRAIRQGNEWAVPVQYTKMRIHTQDGTE